MKTNLPYQITSIQEAKDFLTELHHNGEAFHPEDDALDIVWRGDDPETWELYRLNALMKDIYNLEGNEDPQNMIFDPCGFLLDLDNNEL